MMNRATTLFLSLCLATTASLAGCDSKSEAKPEDKKATDAKKPDDKKAPTDVKAPEAKTPAVDAPAGDLKAPPEGDAPAGDAPAGDVKAPPAGDAPAPAGDVKAAEPTK
jgi:hypothetical protein